MGNVVPVEIMFLFKRFYLYACVCVFDLSNVFSLMFCVNDTKQEISFYGRWTVHFAHSSDEKLCSETNRQHGSTL